MLLYDDDEFIYSKNYSVCCLKIHNNAKIFFSLCFYNILQHYFVWFIYISFYYCVKTPI